MFGSDPREMVRRADQNGNGMIDPSEMQEGMGRYLQRSAERAGLNVNAPLTIDQVVGAMDQARREREGDYSRSSSSNSSSSRSSSQPVSTNPQSFGAASAVAMLPGFDTPGGAAIGGSSASQSQIPLEKRFDERVLERARDRMKEYDRNNNGTIEGEELASYRGDPPLISSDMNKDGIINLEEMALRYQSRYGSSYSSNGPGGPGGPGGSSYSSSPFGSNNSSSSFSSRPFGSPPSGSSSPVSVSPSSPSNGGFPGGGPPGGDRGFRGPPPSMGGPGGGPPGGFPGGPPDSSADNSERVRMFAQSMIQRSDKNGDGKLTRDEWDGVRDAENADANKDGVITSDEMMVRLQSFSRGGPPGGDRGSSDRDRGSSERDRGSSSSGGDRGSSSSRDGGSDRSRSSSSGSSSDRGSYSGRGPTSSANSAPVPKKSYKILSAVERLPQNLPSWFYDSDKNGDGQIAMAEYHRRSTDKDNADEFMKIDANADGMITSQECLIYSGTSR